MNTIKLHWIPERKVLAGGVAGIVTWLLTLLLARIGIDLPAETVGPLVVAASSAFYYLIPPSVQDVLRRVDGELKATFDVKAAAAKLAIAFLLLGGLALGGPTACASYKVQQAETASPAQRLYAIQADYNTGMAAAVAYAESAAADPGVVAVIARMDDLAAGTIRDAQAAVRAGDSVSTAVAVGAAARAVRQLVDYVTERAGASS